MQGRIRQRTNGYWLAIFEDGGGKEIERKSLRTKDRAKAERALKEELAELNAQHARPVITASGRKRLRRPAVELTAESTIGDIVPAYIDDREMAGKVSHMRMRDAWKALQAFFADRMPVEMEGHSGRRLSRAYAQLRARGGKRGYIAPRTIRKELQTLLTALRWHDKSRADHFVVEMPPLGPEERKRILLVEEYRALRNAAVTHPHTWLYINLAYFTAGRPAALLELIWDRVDFENRTIDLRVLSDHGNKGRAIIPMSNVLYDALSAAYKVRATNYVIEYAGKPVSSIRNSFATVVAKAGIGKVSLYILRRTAGSHMLDAGVSIKLVSQYLGHKNVATTERDYAFHSVVALRAGADALDRNVA